MKKIFAPGCDLKRDNKQSVNKVIELLSKYENFKDDNIKCCRANQTFEETTTLITACPGCQQKFTNDNIQNVISLWEILNNDESLVLKNYDGKIMSIHDSCATRDNKELQMAVRSLAKKMNIQIVEPKKTKENTVCCGEIYKGRLEESQVLSKMKERAVQMECEEVLVYCTGCFESLNIGGKKAVHLIDLI